MPGERDFEKKPYSEDERRVADYIVALTNGTVGGGDDPIGFLIASHQTLATAHLARIDR